MTVPSKHILHNILPVLGLKCLNVRICDRDILPWHFSFAEWMLDLSRSCFNSLIWLKIRYICTPQILAYLYERILATKEDNRSKEYLKVHVELCGHFCELRMIATKVRFFLNNSGIIIYNILHRLLLLPFEAQIAYYRFWQELKSPTST